MTRERLKLSDFDYPLPKELIAQYPCPRREDCRLLVLERAKRKISHRRFSDILNYFSCADSLILNNTKVVRARMLGRRARFHSASGGGKQEIFLLEELSKDIYRVLAKPAKKLTVGTKVLFNNGSISATVLADQGMSKTVKFSANGKVENLWQRLGQVPLPPYIKREPQEADQERYQTVYAAEPGATAAPTAGLHFTKELLKAIQDKGINIAYVTLHVSYGTFAPVKCGDITQHKMHKEKFTLPQSAAELVEATKKKGKRIFAVGTTSVRVLEACAGLANTTARGARSGATDLFIYPPYRFKAVDCLLTNFHFPKSTLLMLVSAFAGKELIFKAYHEAIKRKYRLFSYGDAMLIL